MKTDQSTNRDLSIGIIGAGFSGLCMAIQLKRAGFSSFTIFEKSDGVGGTWRNNTYPGAACDIPSFLYSFSFEQKPDWTLKYAEQPEILKYLESCVDKYQLNHHIRFNAEITSACFDANSGLWQIETKGGEHYATNVLVSGCGQLNRPNIPNIPGIQDFQGETFHSARWNHSYDLTNKTVAVIGNGASAIQLVPHLQQQVKQLTVFQRSPNWIITKTDRKFSSLEQWIFKHIPGAAQLYRSYIYLMLELRWFPFSDYLTSVSLSIMRKRFVNKMEQRIHDEQLKPLLLPNYLPGCKRILLSNNYLETLQQPNVSLVQGSIQQITPNALVMEGGNTYPADCIIFATGFKTTDFLAPINIEGLDGKTLHQEWQDGAEAHKGITVSGFPNLFMLYGPNTNLGHNSVIFMIERQVQYILKCIRLLSENSLKFINLRVDKQHQYNQTLQQRASRTVWNSGCTNWYRLGSGKIVNNWPWASWRYLFQTGRVDLSNFEVEPAIETDVLPVYVEEKIQAIK